jgi:hypothetical protein
VSAFPLWAGKDNFKQELVTVGSSVWRGPNTADARLSNYNYKITLQIMGNPLIGTGTIPGEAGVVGDSQEAEGVRGVGHKGAGVSGTSEKWIGVYGESQEVEGVRGVGHKGAGVSGHSEKWIGTYGESQEAEGVRGVGHKGAGVSGTSESWAGVYGKGVPAGFFEGDVDIAGKLNVNGVSFDSLVQRIIQLEKEVALLKKIPRITVSSQGAGKFQVKGSGFLESHDVTIRAVNPAIPGTSIGFPQAGDPPIKSDGSGTIDHTVTIAGLPAAVTKLNFSANDGRKNPKDVTGTLWSNTVSVNV